MNTDDSRYPATPPNSPHRRSLLQQLGAGALVSAVPLLAHAATADDDTYDQESIVRAATDFFGKTTEGLAKVIEKAFKEQGRPNAYIRGEEASAAITVGVRYGDGDLVMKAGPTAKVYWAGPSVGFDFGANASKVFMLIYKLPNADAIYRRYPGVEGSLYYLGGVGLTYQRLDNVTVAPIRVGVGIRTGVSVGYLHFRREKSLNPL